MRTPKSELDTRAKRLQEKMNQVGLDIIVITQNADLFYFTGCVQQGVYILPAHSEPVFLVRKDMGRALMESALTHILPIKGFRDIPPRLSELKITWPKTVGYELDCLPVTMFQRLDAIFQGEIRDASGLIKDVRSIKSQWEIERIKESAEIANRVFQNIRNFVQPEIEEIELAARIEYCARSLGHQGIVRMRSFNSEIFFGHILSGINSAVAGGQNTPLSGSGLSPAIGQGASRKKIERGEPIIVDLATCVNGYICDQTRTFALGDIPDELACAHKYMIEVEDYMLNIAKVGVSPTNVYNECMNLVKKLGYSDRFMGVTGSQAGFIGHGVGIELDEPPYIAKGFENQFLMENMVFAFEPKVVFPGKGAVGIEDTFIVTSNGVERLSITPRELFIIR